MTIGEISIKYKLSKDTLRYYEKLGLIGPINKTSKQRIYTINDEEAIKFVICMKNAGLSLENIAKFIKYYQEGDKTISKRLDILTNQKAILLNELAEKKKTLEFLNYKIKLYSKEQK